MKKNLYKRKRVKPYIVIPIYAAVIALLTNAISSFTDIYIDNRVFDEQINNMNYTVSEIQKYAYKYEEQSAEEAIQSIKESLYKEIDNSVFLPDLSTFPLTFMRIPSGLRMIYRFNESYYFSDETGNIHGIAVLVDENKNIVASNNQVLEACLYLPDAAESHPLYYSAQDCNLLGIITEYFKENGIIKPLKNKKTAYPEFTIDKAYVNRNDRTFIIKEYSFKWYNCEIDEHGLITWEENAAENPVRVDTTVLDSECDSSDYELVIFNSNITEELPFAFLAGFHGEPQEIIDSTDRVARDLYAYEGFISVDDRTGNDGTVYSLRNIPLDIDGKNYILSLRYFYDPEDPYIKNVKKSWTVSIAVLLSIIGFIMLLIRYFRLKSVYRYEDYQRDLTNHLAHDIKTPLTSISGYAENILTGELNEEEQKKYLTSIINNISFTDSIINRTLFLNHPDNVMAGKEKNDLKPEIENTFEKYRVMLEEKNINFETTGETVLKANRDQLGMIIENLISNAVKYTPENGTIKVALGKRSVTISNTVTGKLKTKNLKKPFVRGDKARSNVNGTGLGLSIADRAASANGCRLTLSCSDNEFRAKLSKKALPFL